MKAKLLLGAAALTLLAACQGSKTNDAYTLTANLPQDLNDTQVYLVNYDTGLPIDSAVVENGTVTLAGTVENPMLVRLVSPSRRLGTFVLEAGQITLDDGVASGTPLNDLNNNLDTRLIYLDSLYNNTSDSLTRVAVGEEYTAYLDSVTNANLDNPIGYYYFIQSAYTLDYNELMDLIAKHPSLADYTRVQKLVKDAEAKEATSPGKQYIDFAVPAAEGDTVRLSDYMRPDKLLLVDFWASWCGPCRRETAVIKDLLAQYGSKGLDVLGVAVWDEPENTLKAVEQLQLPWPQILNAQSIPTDLYGIPAIPCILLIAPDGTILSRGKQGEDLRADVAAYFAGTLTPETVGALQAEEGVAQD